MKITELIALLQYELDSTGDSDVHMFYDDDEDGYISNEVYTGLDIGKGGVCTFWIQNKQY